MRNLKLAVRTVAKSPFVTIVAVLSLALGLGANAAIFSMVNLTLLQSLPVADPSRLVNLAASNPQLGGNTCNQAGACDEVFSYPMFRDLEKAKTGLSGLAAHRSFGVNVAMAGQTPINGEAMYVSGSYFPVLGLRPALGRLIAPSDDQAIAGSYVAVLDHAYWESQLASDPNVLGRTITVNGQDLTIIGIGPRGFSGTTLGTRPYVYVPITMRGVLTLGAAGFERQRDFNWVYVFGRLAPGVSIGQARSGLNAAYSPILSDIEAPLHKDVSDKTLAQFKARQIRLTDGRSGQSSVHANAKTPLVLLFAITGIVLLIACANIANLLLARAAGRQMEMAVRLSMGATRRQLVVQLLTESLLLAALGGLASIPAAHLTLAGIGRMLPSEVQRTIDFHLSGTAMLFTGAMALATSLFFGLAPSIRSTRPDMITALRSGAGHLSGGRAAARFRSGLVTAQIALSIMLLTCAGLFVKSLHNVSAVDLGLDAENVVTFGISPRLSGYDTTGAVALVRRASEALGAIPGIRGVATGLVALLAGNNWGQNVSVEGFKKTPDTDDNTSFNAVSPKYFETLGIPIIAGRDFTASDNRAAPKVAIVNEAFAKKFNLGRDAVGKRLSVGNDSLNIEIVGLVKNWKYSGVTPPIPSVLVLPSSQTSESSTTSFYVRTALPTTETVRAIRETMRGLDPKLPIEDLKTLPQQVRENVFLERMMSTTSAAFAVLATLLAAIGLYGVLAYSVTQRTREIGVRMALGADRGRVRGMVLRQVGMMTAIGGVIGIAGAFVLGRGAAALLYQLEGNDPLVFAAAAGVLTLVAMGAGLLPAMRASRIDPMRALRYD
ncbi:MAG TPA: ABC transporter permease [Gemmatimonadaceae bacterium]|nr:ABC transporter permease [Gemmatimonadaceae bacterium]